MGQSRTYLDVIAWQDSLTQTEREARGPFQSAFGVGHGESAGDAVATARRAATIANQVFDQVKEQAVYALLADNLPVRAIAARTGIPKSEVHRISRRLGRDGDLPGSVATVPVSRDEVRDQVRAAWGHR
ncbi:MULTISPECIES: helix-turn-helix domain-containing protein [Rhodococcus]|uniref:helix-turn-helix domain-containing protein n=1 Tax=Rhodococcus TaxID=1827 RepID=UPI0005A1403F|nr:MULTISPECIES: helix-turn-helix domain-containing protein [Rhodococcus]